MTNNILDHRNARAAQYSQKAAARINNIVRPLRSVGITVFKYTEIFDDGHFLFLSNHLETIQDHFLKYMKPGQYTQKHINGLEDNDYCFLLYPRNVDDTVINFYQSQGIHHTLALMVRRLDTVRIWEFATTTEDSEILNFYANSKQILSRFVFYFNDKAQKYMKTSDKTKLGYISDYEVSKSPLDSCDKYSQFLEMISLKRYEVSSPTGSPLYFTQREVESLSHLSQGKSAREIGEILGVSPRTAEDFIASAKKKIGVRSKSDLVTFYKSSRLSLYGE